MTVTRRGKKLDRRTNRHPPPPHTPNNLPFPAHRPVQHPSFGIDPLIESGYQDDDYYEDDEEFDLEEELERIEDSPEEEGEASEVDIMTESWPSEVPNKLGEVYKAGTSTYETNPDDTRLSCLGLPLSLPYEVESLAEMDDRLDYIACKLVECVKAREWNLGFRMWDSALGIWQSMGYPMRKEMKIKLAFLYYEIIFIPGLSSSLIEDAGGQFIGLVSDRSLNIFDFRIPWRPLYDALYNELFPHPNKLARHSVNLAPMYLNVAEAAQRYFHPGDVDEMLETILPKFEPSMDSILATQTFLVHFLPISHCQRWLPLVFRLWYGLNSGLWDDQASDLAGQLAIAHVEPGRSDPSLIDRIPRGTLNTPEEEANNPNHRRLIRGHKARLLEVAGEIEEDEDGLNYWAKKELLPEEEQLSDPSWRGIRKDVGIFSDEEFEFLMSKCLRSLNVPVGGAVASSTAMSVTMADARASRKILDTKKPIDRVQSLAETIIFCMSEDAPAASDSSNAVTPGTATPVQPALARLQNGSSMRRAGSSDSLAIAGQKSEANRRYLGGSKALDHLSRLLTSCETFFHPSNSGHWTVFLTTFLSHLAANFAERWKAQEEPHCKVPQEWRLTDKIKREFVLCLRPLALTAIFNKDMESMTPAVSALKKLALLEPDLIMPATIERAIPSLQGLEETQRTPAVTYTLAALAQPLAARNIWRSGGMYIADIFALLLPGIDLNDPSKTGLTCMAISNMVDFIHMSDISEVEDSSNIAPGMRATRKVERPKVEDDPDDPIQLEIEELSPEEVNERIRFATSGFRDWVPEFLGRVLLLFANLPEEGGKSGRAGGKTEQLTVMSVLHTCGTVFSALDDKLFDVALEQIAEYTMTTCRANAVAAVAELVKNLACANASKVFAKLFPIARQRILAELKAGASSTRTLMTSIPVASDAALHWWSAILHGMLIPARVELSLPEYRAPLVDLCRKMVESTYSQRGWSWTGKVIEKTIACLTLIALPARRMVDDSTYDSDDFKANHTLYWGKLCRSTEVKPPWRVPTDQDIDMAFEIIAIADSAVTRIEELLNDRSMDEKVWSNDFCRAVNCINQVLKGTYALIGEVESQKTGAVPAETYLPQELLALPKPFKCGFLLTDPTDPRYQHVAAFRARVGETLHKAASALRDAAGSDNSVESIKLLVTTISTYLTAYGIRSRAFSDSQNAYTGMAASKKLYESQRKHHRQVFMAAANVHAQNRLSSVSYYRSRSALDDKLIINMLDFCLSPFVRIRRQAQGSLENLSKLYRGTWVLCFPTLFDALQSGTDPDRMKGALYVLRYNGVGIGRIARDWRQLVELAECLLNAHHENKASVQALVHKAIDELISGMKEPNSHLIDVAMDKVDAAAMSMEQIIRYKPDPDLIQRLHEGIKGVVAKQDEQWDIFVDRVIGIAQNPQLNWRYQLAASRFLLAAARRDRPTDVRMAKFFVQGMINPHPRIRDFGTVGTTRLMFNIVLRALCEGDEKLLFLEEPIDPQTSIVRLEDTSPAFTQKYLSSFREPLPEDESQAVLQDRIDTGWLAWGKEMEVSRMPRWDEQTWNPEPSCHAGMSIIEEAIKGKDFWQTIADHWAQEDTRNYPSATHIDFILSLTQLFRMPVFDAVRPIIEGYLSEMESTKVYDRHKTRSMWEFISGLIRGSEDWPGKERKVFWDWFTPRIPELFNNIRHDTTKCWDISIEYVLNDRDPRRFKPLVDFCIQTGLDADFTGGSAFDLTRRVQVVRSVIRCFQWRFNAWADDFIDLYFKSVDCPYAEVRGLVSSLLNAIDQLKFHPSYPSARALTDDILNDPNSEKDIMHIRSGLFMPQLQDIIKELPALVSERPHGPKAAQSRHDLTALTVMTWLSVELADVHAAAAFPYIIEILDVIFGLRDLNDNPDLQRTAGRLLAMITSITPSLELIEPLMQGLISILQDAPLWKTKTHCMPVLSLVYYRNLSLLSETCKAKALDVVAACLKDPNQEVREIAAATLSGFLRCSQRSMIDVLKNRFTREIKSIVLPKRRGGAPGQTNPEYQTKLIELHGAVLGAASLVEAFPYTVPKFIPKLLADVLAPRASDPAPISTTIRTTVASFKRTHEKYQDKFTEDELSAMNYAQAGNSYYA